MAMDDTQVARTFEFEAKAIADVRARWRVLMDACVWHDLKATRIGALPRLRKRMLAVGEGMRSLFSARAWMPVARERVKGAMAASLNLRDALLQLERAAQLIEGGEDFAQFESHLLAFRQRLLRIMEHHEQGWCDLLEAQYDEVLDDDDEAEEDTVSVPPGQGAGTPSTDT